MYLKCIVGIITSQFVLIKMRCTITDYLDNAHNETNNSITFFLGTMTVKGTLWLERDRRDVTSASHPISSTLTDQLLLALVDQVNHTCKGSPQSHSLKGLVSSSHGGYEEFCKHKLLNTVLLPLMNSETPSLMDHHVYNVIYLTVILFLHTVTARGMEAEEQTTSTIDFKNPLFVSDIPPASGDKNDEDHKFIIDSLNPNDSHHNNVTSALQPDSDAEMTRDGEFGWRVMAASPCSVTCGEG